jgi:hypothetical protein
MKRVNGPQAGHGGVANGFDFGESGFLLSVGELDDEDAVLGDEADECDEADLRVDVDGRRPAFGQRVREAGWARRLTE